MKINFNILAPLFKRFKLSNFKPPENIHTMIANFTSFSRLPYLLIMLVVVVGACTSEKKKEGSASSEFDEASKDLKEKVEKVIYSIPSPSEIPYIIESTGADFNPNIVNKLEKYESYSVSQHKAAFNLGVYATDIGYLSSYGKTQEALNYMDVCMKLSESIGIQDAIDLEILSRFEKNLGNPDSLAQILDESIAKSDEYLQQNERNNVAALIIGGTFVEGLYIATQIISTYPKDILADDQRMVVLTPIIRLVVKQNESLKDMISLLKGIDNKDEWIEATINSLEELQESYESFEPEEKISSGKGNELLSDKTLQLLTKQIASIRENVIY